MVCHNNVFPIPAVALHTGAVVFKQKSEGFVPEGALGIGVTLISIVASV